MKTTIQKIARILLFTLPLAAGAAGNNWMSSLNSGLYLSQFSISGTHESMALYESVSGTAKCQSLSLTDQLNAGVRFIDIRCRHYNNAFVIHHGSVYQNANFDDVLNACTSFLSSNPTECIIMSVKEEYTASGDTRTFEQTFDSYVAKNPGIWYLGSGIPTLGSVRGKIVLFRRFSASSTPKGFDASYWPDNTSFAYGALSVQDNYKVSDNNTKWNQITAQFSAARNSSDNTLYVDFCSGYQTTWYGAPNIPAVANDINQRLTSYFNGTTYGRHGIVLMDFVDASHCAQVYNTAYHPVANGTWRLMNYNSGKALDVTGYSTTAGASIEQWTYNGGGNQKWTLTSQGNNGGYYSLLATHDSQALDVSGGSMADGAGVIQWPWTGGNNQIWQIVPTFSGTYKLVNKNSGKVLDVSGASAVDGASVIQWTWSGGNNQKWQILAP
jgi:Ricin-type beta-trefoil lectin domain-like/Phosphatidylinositol-specific phospholipase C, X domain